MSKIVCNLLILGLLFKIKWHRHPNQSCIGREIVPINIKGMKMEQTVQQKGSDRACTRYS